MSTMRSRMPQDERQHLLQELESLVASRGFEPGMATRMWDAWGDAEAEVDRLETINQALREALAPFVEAADEDWTGAAADFSVALIVTRGDVQRAREALVAEGSGDDA